ncbi:MAG: hypothetical protein HQL82_13960 [Magnetococcales bacterium]|nr:hypothetical protein [Magnetococcales bacterium]
MKRFFLTVTFTPDGVAVPAAPGPVLFESGPLRVTGDNLHPPVRRLRTSRGELLVLGHPVVGRTIDDDAVGRHLESSNDPATFAAGLNGSYLLLWYDPTRQSLTILTDRFASRAFYYWKQGATLVGSTSCMDLSGRIPDPQWVPEAFFEFLYFRRLFGDKTFAAGIRFLEFATVLDAASGARQRYWTPSFAKLDLGLDDFARELARRLRNSVALYQSDGRRHGLMLSGGLDSRAILAAAASPLVCFTNCPVENNEFEVAGELTRRIGTPHHFLARPADYLNDKVDDAVFLSGGMTSYTEAQFGGYEAVITPQAQAVFLGLGLDIFFCGHYLPKSPLRLWGRETCSFRMHPCGADLAQQFMSSVTYRLKSSDPWSIVQDRRRAALQDALRATVEERMALGRTLGAEGYDLWEFMHLHNFARHYSFQMAFSMQGYVDYRIPAMENDLYALCLAMPLAHKYNWRAYQLAIRALNPELARVRNANNNIRADLSLGWSTVVRWQRALANRVVGPRFRSMPRGEDRSWPAPRASIDGNPAIRDMVEALATSERLDSLGLFDMERVRAVVEDHLANRRDHAIFLNLLVTMDRFLLSRPSG